MKTITHRNREYVPLADYSQRDDQLRRLLDAAQLATIVMREDGVAGYVRRGLEECIESIEADLEREALATAKE